MTDDQPTTPVRMWMHQRKGRIVGRVIEESDAWVTVRLTEPNDWDDAGATMTFRRSFAKELTA